MSRENFQREMKDSEDSIATDGVQFHKVLDRELKFAERKKCDEKYDIRDTSVRQDDCFTPSGRKVVDAIIRSSEKPKVGSDPNLHSDTTEPGENEVVAIKKGGWANSASELLTKQKDKKVPDAIKRKVFNS